LFDDATGYLIGITNWGTGRTTQSLNVSAVREEIIARLKSD